MPGKSKRWEIQRCRDHDATTAISISPQNLVIESSASGWFVIETAMSAYGTKRTFLIAS